MKNIFAPLRKEVQHAVIPITLSQAHKEKFEGRSPEMSPYS